MSSVEKVLSVKSCFCIHEKVMETTDQRCPTPWWHFELVGQTTHLLRNNVIVILTREFLPMKRFRMMVCWSKYSYFCVLSTINVARASEAIAVPSHLFQRDKNTLRYRLVIRLVTTNPNSRAILPPILVLASHPVDHRAHRHWDRKASLRREWA